MFVNLTRVSRTNVGIGRSGACGLTTLTCGSIPGQFWVKGGRMVGDSLFRFPVCSCFVALFCFVLLVWVRRVSRQPSQSSLNRYRMGSFIRNLDVGRCGSVGDRIGFPG